MKTISKAKPFIKWVGGKGQLIEQLDAQLPADFENWDDVTYIEPHLCVLRQNLLAELPKRTVNEQIFRG